MSICFGSPVIETHVLNLFSSANGSPIASQDETVSRQTFDGTATESAACVMNANICIGSQSA